MRSAAVSRPLSPVPRAPALSNIEPELCRRLRRNGAAFKRNASSRERGDVRSRWYPLGKGLTRGNHRHTLPVAMNIIRIETRAELPWAVIRAKGGNWVAACDPLGLTVQSDTWAHLMEDIAQALNALFLDLLQEGELDRFLRDRGFQAISPLPSKPDDTWFDVPFSASRTTARDFEVAVH